MANLTTVVGCRIGRLSLSLVVTLPTFDDEVAQSSVLRAAHTESPGGEPGLRGLCGVNRHSYHGPYLQ